MSADQSRVAPSDLVGPVRRTLLVDETGRRDTTTDAVWLQGPGRLYVDLRRPQAPDKATAAALATVRSPDDLAAAPDAALAHLAAHEGFAGRFTLTDDLARWERLVDLHPSTGVPDEGTLVRAGDVLVETGVHAHYVEHWRPDPGTHRPDDAAAVLLCDPASGRTAVLVRVGARFGLAVGRPVPLPDGARLLDLVRAAPPDRRADVLDAEVALGRVESSGRWVVELSSLPWGVGRDVAPFDHGATLTTRTTPDDAVRTWLITEREGGRLVPQGPAAPQRDPGSDEPDPLPHSAFHLIEHLTEHLTDHLTAAGGSHGTA